MLSLIQDKDANEIMFHPVLIEICFENFSSLIVWMLAVSKSFKFVVSKMDIEILLSQSIPRWNPESSFQKGHLFGQRLVWEWRSLPQGMKEIKITATIDAKVDKHFK